MTKRIAIGLNIDKNGWKSASYDLLDRHIAFNHHHEIVWLTWLLLCSNIDLSEQLVTALSANTNAHIRSLIVAGYTDARIARKPPIRLGSKISTTDSNWLLTLVARSTGYSKAAFSGSLAPEFDHLAKKAVKLIDIQAHIETVRAPLARAISRTRYGYDNDDNWGAGFAGFDDIDDELGF